MIGSMRFIRVRLHSGLDMEVTLSVGAQQHLNERMRQTHLSSGNMLRRHPELLRELLNMTVDELTRDGELG